MNKLTSIPECMSPSETQHTLDALLSTLEMALRIVRDLPSSQDWSIPEDGLALVQEIREELNDSEGDSAKVVSRSSEQLARVLSSLNDSLRNNIANANVDTTILDLSEVAAECGAELYELGVFGEKARRSTNEEIKEKVREYSIPEFLRLDPSVQASIISKMEQSKSSSEAEKIAFSCSGDEVLPAGFSAEMFQGDPELLKDALAIHELVERQQKKRLQRLADEQNLDICPTDAENKAGVAR